MNLDIKKAFNSPFSEPQWYKKMIFPLALACLGIVSSPEMHLNKIVIAVVFLLTLIPGFVLSGFFIKYLHNEIYDETPLLPVLKGNVKEYLINGLKFLGISLIYLSVFVIATLILIALTKTQSIISFVAIALYIFFAIIMFMIFFFSESAFADNYKFKDALDINRLQSLVVKVPKEIFITILIGFGLTILMSIIAGIAGVLNLKMITSAIIAVPIQFIMYNLNAQLYKIAKSKLDTIEI